MEGAPGADWALSCVLSFQNGQPSQALVRPILTAFLKAWKYLIARGVWYDSAYPLNFVIPTETLDE
jgi:hypothetical protein